MAIKVSGTEVISDDKRILNNESLPDIRPSLLLDFANSKTLDPRITFTRGSTATYWDGKTTAKAEENLFTYSQAIDQWVDDGVSVTADNTTAPDGTTTADKLFVTTTSIFKKRLQNKTLVNGNSYTFSFWVKGDTVTSCSFYMQHGTSTSATVLEGTATLGSTGGTFLDVTGLSTSAWARIAVTYNVTSSSSGQVSIYIGDKSSQTAGDSIFIWGAQLEQRSSATAYTPTTSSPIVKYQPVLQTAASGEARFDHDPVTGESKGLLIEEARTNLLPYSEAFDNAEFQKVNAIITANSVVAPDGTLTADTLIADTTSGEHYIQENLTAATGTFTDSVYAKSSGDYFFAIRPVHAGADEGTTRQGYFDLNTGTVHSNTSGTTATIEDVGNGWYRCSLTYTVSGTLSGSYGARFQLYGNDGSGGIVSLYAGDNYSGVYIWGAQREAGSFPTSYIPTSGSTVTRAAESAEITGTNFSGFFSQLGFSLFREVNIGWDMLRSPSLSGVTRITNSGQTNNIDMRVVTDTSNPQLDVYMQTFGANYADTSDNSNISSLSSFKQILSIDSESLLTNSTGGGISGEDTSVVLGNDYSTLKIDISPDRFWYKKVAFYPKKLTANQQLAMTEE